MRISEKSEVPAYSKALGFNEMCIVGRKGNRLLAVQQEVEIVCDRRIGSKLDLGIPLH